MRAALNNTIEGGTQSLNSKSTAKNTQIYAGGTQIVDNTSTSDVIEVYSGGVLDVRGGTATNITQHDGAALKVTTYDLTVSGTNSEGHSPSTIKWLTMCCWKTEAI